MTHLCPSGYYVSITAFCCDYIPDMNRAKDDSLIDTIVSGSANVATAGEKGNPFQYRPEKRGIIMIGFLRLQRLSMRLAVTGAQIGKLLKHKGHLLKKFRSVHWRNAARQVVAELVAMLDVSRKEVDLREVLKKTLVLRDGKYVEEEERILVQPRGELIWFVVPSLRG